MRATESGSKSSGVAAFASPSTWTSSVVEAVGVMAVTKRRILMAALSASA
jgi:hypothetical protein